MGRATAEADSRLLRRQSLCLFNLKKVNVQVKGGSLTWKDTNGFVPTEHRAGCSLNDVIGACSTGCLVACCTNPSLQPHLCTRSSQIRLCLLEPVSSRGEEPLPILHTWSNGTFSDELFLINACFVNQITTIVLDLRAKVRGVRF